jgi:hypothetical protein
MFTPNGPQGQVSASGAFKAPLAHVQAFVARIPKSQFGESPVGASAIRERTQPKKVKTMVHSGVPSPGLGAGPTQAPSSSLTPGAASAMGLGGI